MRRFLIQAKQNGFYEIAILELATGMRRGEISVLKWSDLDLETGALYIQRQAIHLKGRINISTPKTPASDRTVILPKEVHGLRRTFAATPLEHGMDTNCNRHKDPGISKAFRPFFLQNQRKSQARQGVSYLDAVGKISFSAPPRAALDKQERAILDAIKDHCPTVSGSISKRRFHGAFRLEYMFCAG